MAKPSETAVLAWTRLLRAQAAALGQVEHALKAEGFPPLEWYDVLLELERAGQLRPKDLQARLLVAQYNISRLLDRMLAAGLVEQRSCPSDKRGIMLGLTQQGRALRLKMWPVYAAAIERAMGSKLADDEARALSELLGRLYDAEGCARARMLAAEAESGAPGIEALA